MPNVRREILSIDRITLIENNPRSIDDGDLEKLKLEITRDPNFLLQRPPLVNHTSDKYFCYAGSQRIKSAKALGRTEIEVFIEDDVPKDIQDRRTILDNTHHGKWDFEILTESFDFSLDDFKDMNLPEVEDFLIDHKAESQIKQTQAKNALQSNFIVPPFSILDTKQAYWQDRKRTWEDLGIKSQESREEIELMAKSAQNTEVYNLRNKMREALGREPEWDEVIEKAKQKGLKVFEGASIFDPVLCEVLYTWFSNEGHLVLDPFAGGSVRGIVAAMLNRTYWGVDLREEQVQANVKQAAQLIKDFPGNPPLWKTGDSVNVKEITKDVEYDFIFSCPPYHDLEQYSDDSRDLSNLTYEQFQQTYTNIIKECCESLKENRFACFVVSEIRDKKGFYKNFVKDTIEAFEANEGVRFYNDIILLNQIASAAIRAGRQFNGGRKVTRVHQNVLVFYKGDPKKITELYPKLVAKIDEETLEQPE